MKTAAILLPKAFPDLFWIWAAVNADRIVIHDSLHFDRKAHVNRGKIVTADGPQFIYIPLEQSGKTQTLAEIRHAPAKSWIKSLHKTLVMSYRNAIYFDFYEAEVMDDLGKAGDFGTFADFALFLTSQWLKYLDTPVSWGRATAMPEGPAGTDELLLHSGCEEALLDPASRHFQPRTMFPSRAVFTEPDYRHHFRYSPGCTILDLLFSCGPESWKVIDRLKFRN